MSYAHSLTAVAAVLAHQSNTTGSPLWWAGLAIPTAGITILLIGLPLLHEYLRPGGSHRRPRRMPHIRVPHVRVPRSLFWRTRSR